MIKINIVNTISFSRLLSAPVILWMVLENNLQIAFWVFIYAVFTDLIDGFLARKLNLVSEFGKIIDPLSDKLLIFSVFITLSYVNLMAAPIVMIIVLRDLFILIGTVLSLLFKKKINLTPLTIGKITFFSQSLYAGMLLFNYAYLYDLEIIIKYFGLFTVCITLISGILYIIRWYQEII